MRHRMYEKGDLNIVGDAVEALRKQRGFSQREVMEAILKNGVKMNPSGISKLEGGRRFVTDRELKAVCQALGVTPNDLLGYGCPVETYIERLSRYLVYAKPKYKCGLCGGDCEGLPRDPEVCAKEIQAWMRERYDQYQRELPPPPPPDKVYDRGTGKNRPSKKAAPENN